MIIEIVKELLPENRVAILPEAVAALIALNCDVIVEKDAGLNAFVSNYVVNPSANDHPGSP